jgi:oligoribonuclease (3'-5' exoribonuclease)
MVKYFSIDCEFSGLDHRKHCLLSIGIIEINKNGNYYSPNYNHKLYLELKPFGEIDPQAMAINKLDLENLELYGVSKENAVREIRKFLKLKNNDIAVFIGYCNVLDKIFIDQLFNDVGESSPFHYEVIDISSLALGKIQWLEWGFTEKELLTKLLQRKDCIINLSENQKHNALYDATLQAEEFCELMNYY